MSLHAFEESARLRRSRRAERTLFDLPTAGGMLPLVRRILEDIAAKHAKLAHQKLQHRRLSVGLPADWQSRTAHYRLAEVIDLSTQELEALRGELCSLSVVLLDPLHGVAGFPTIVNGSLAYLVFRSAEDRVRHWRYRDQPKLRPIPESWHAQTPLQAEPEGLLV